MNEETKYLINEVVGYIDVAKRCGKSSEYYFYWLGVANGVVLSAMVTGDVPMLFINRLNKILNNRAFVVVRLP